MELEFEKNERSQKAMGYFKQGYNCSQAVFLAFSDLYDMDEKLAARLSSSFGGGMGRLREVCGAVSGMFMVAGALYGYDSPDCGQDKTNHYARIQALAKNFSNENGSIVCRELLGGLAGQAGPQAEKRTDEYYKKRPCVQLVGMATAIMDMYIKNNEEIMLTK